MHESSLHSDNSFVTLTYDDDKLPFRGQLRYRDVQLFLKRLRKQGGFRFFCTGEYGEVFFRPHYHLALFGYWPTDAEKFSMDSDYWDSKSLESVWGHGRVCVGKLTFDSAAYIAGYCVKKVTGRAAPDHYRRFDEHGEYQLKPEFARMSLRPAIGRRWVEKYADEVYPGDFVVSRGFKAPPPRYYDKVLEQVDPRLLEDVEYDRLQKSLATVGENTVERLAVREQVAAAKHNQKVRKL